MFTEQEIESFLHGNDPEEFIVAIEFDYASNSIYKIKEIPGKGKEIRKDTFIPFAWVGDLRGLNFYQSSNINSIIGNNSPDYVSSDFHQYVGPICLLLYIVSHSYYTHS